MFTSATLVHRTLQCLGFQLPSENTRGSCQNWLIVPELVMDLLETPQGSLSYQDFQAYSSLPFTSPLNLKLTLLNTHTHTKTLGHVFLHCSFRYTRSFLSDWWFLCPCPADIHVLWFTAGHCWLRKLVFLLKRQLRPMSSLPLGLC